MAGRIAVFGVAALLSGACWGGRGAEDLPDAASVVARDAVADARGAPAGSGGAAPIDPAAPADASGGSADGSGDVADAAVIEPRLPDGGVPPPAIQDAGATDSGTDSGPGCVCASGPCCDGCHYLSYLSACGEVVTLSECTAGRSSDRAWGEANCTGAFDYGLYQEFSVQRCSGTSADCAGAVGQKLRGVSSSCLQGETTVCIEGQCTSVPECQR